MITNEKLRELYLEDMKLPDTFHGRSTPKVRDREPWLQFEPYYKHGSPIDLTGKRVWVWSDQHFGHNNIIKYAGRPFDAAVNMDDAMVRAYHELVGPDDVVIWNGDIVFGSVNKMNELLARLPGYKIHILGNHDIDRSGKPLKLDVDESHICYVINADQAQLLFTHYHLENVPEGCVNVHGHIHQQVANPWNINICVEHTDYAPMDLSLVAERAVAYLSSL